MENKKLIAFEVSDSLRNQLKLEAYKKDISVSAVIRYILTEYFKSLDDKEKQ